MGKFNALKAVLIVLWIFLPICAQSLPNNFRNVDIFYVGGMPDVDDLDEFAELGILHIISLHIMPKAVARRARQLGIEVHRYPWRTSLDRVDEIMAILDTAPPYTVFLHCQHGADRTGAATAYWLHTRRGYDPFLALSTVISPKDKHIQGLVMLAREYDYLIDPKNDPLLGRFSGAKNGGLEGLKLRGGRWYTMLARNYLRLTLGPPIHAPAQNFWKD